MKKVRFLDLSIKNSREKKRLKTIFSKSLDDGVFVLGKPVENFEKKISNILNLKYSIGVSSGTNAVYLALKAIGIKPGDEVIVPCMSWYSTFTSVVMNKAIPIGIDIDDDLLMNLNHIKSKVTKKTKAILYVHFTGYVKDLTNLSKYCKSKNIFLIEDCAQSFFGRVNKKQSGTFGDIAAFSMNPMKVFSALGDAGAIATNNGELYKKIKVFRYAGVNMKKDECLYPELNHKIDTIQAKFLDYKLSLISGVVKKRILNAKYYDKNLKYVTKPKFSNRLNNVYYTYQIKCKKRDKLKFFLKKNGIETKIQQQKLLYDHSGFKKYNIYKSNFPIGRKMSKQSLCIPIHEKLKNSEIKFVVKKINEFYS